MLVFYRPAIGRTRFACSGLPTISWAGDEAREAREARRQE